GLPAEQQHSPTGFPHGPQVAAAGAHRPAAHPHAAGDTAYTGTPTAAASCAAASTAATTAVGRNGGERRCDIPGCGSRCGRAPRMYAYRTTGSSVRFPAIVATATASSTN